MDRDLPKPFLEIAGRTILEHSLSRFVHLPGLREVILPVSGAFMERSAGILESVMPDSIECRCVEGGKERQHSVANALSVLSETDLVIIHDAVRPFVKKEQIEQCCTAAARMGGAVLGVPVKDTIKKVDSDRMIVKTPDRKGLWQAQTPQVFRRGILLEAYRQAEDDNFYGTDDASLVERTGNRITMVEGSRSNFKITFPLDLQLATLLLEGKHTK